LSLSVSPFGWSSVNGFTFNWSDGFDDALYFSGLAGYQYKINGTADDWTTYTSTQLKTVSDIQAINGQNTFFIRSIDNAGNVGSVRQTFFYYNGDAPSAPTAISVSPQGSTSNNFTFSWGEPASHNEAIIGYRYSINASPQSGNTTYISLSDLPPEASYNSTTKILTLSDIPAATLQGFNYIYVVAVDQSGKVSYSSGNIATIGFECNTPAPGTPTNVELFDTSNKAAAKYSITVNWAEPAFKGVGFKLYNIERSTDGNIYTNVGTSSGTSFVNTGLTSSKYYYRVISEDNSGNTSAASGAVNMIPTGRYTTPPEIAIQPEVTAKVTTASLRWVTDRVANSFVEIGEDVQYGLTQGQFDLVTDHKVSIAGLKPSTVYHYRVKFQDPDGNIGYSADNVFATAPAPRVERVAIQDIRLKMWTI
jgi:hypothetical protein